MKKYARLRQECSEFENALYDATPEVSFTEGSRGTGGLADYNGLGLTLTSALKKLGSFRETTGSRRHTVAPNHHQPCAPTAGNGSRSGSARSEEDASQSGRWASAETGSLSGRWGSVSTSDHWDEPSLSLSRSGRLVQDGEPWTASKPSSQPVERQFSSLRGSKLPLEVVTVPANPRESAVQHNISMKETHGWLASVTRPLQPRKTQSSDPNEFNWRAAATTTKKPTGPVVSQSMRYDRLKTIDLAENASFDEEDGGRYAVMQKASSMREGGVHSGTIMAMARAYSEKHGVPQAILECVACKRGLGVVVQGTPGNDTSFCHSCRPHAVAGWSYHSTTVPSESGRAKRRGMMHFCKKFLRLGKKPNKAKG